MNEWRPFPKQEQALLSTSYETLFGGSRGPGKTDAGLAWLKYDIKNPRYRALVIRKNADDLSDWIDRARRFYPEANIAYRPAVITFPWGAVIRTGHLKDDQAYTKYQGHEYPRMLIEELTQIPDEKRYLQLISSCRSTVPDLDPMIFSTTNPGGLGHAWVKKRFVDPAIPGTEFKDPTSGRTRIFIPATIDDNPLLQEIDPGYVKTLDALKDTDEELWKAWRMGSWDVFAGQFFREWSRESHVVAPFQIPPDWYRFMAFDWGVNHPFSIGWYTTSPDGRVYKYRELVLNGDDFFNTYGIYLTPSKLATVINKINKNNHEQPSYMVSDTQIFNQAYFGKGAKALEEGDSIAEVMAKKGIPLTRADKDRINGWSRMREWLSPAPDGLPWFQVFETCPETIRSISELMYDENKFEDARKQDGDDPADETRYALMSRPPITKQEDTQDTVISRHYAKIKRQRKDNDAWNQWLSS